MKSKNTINPKISQHIFDTCKDYHSSISPINDDDVIELVRYEKILHKEVVSEHRWYNVEFRVIRINGMLIGYNDGATTGDNNAEECGFAFDPESICEVKEKKEMVLVTTYVRK